MSFMPAAAKDARSPAFAISGVLTELHVASGKENLLAQIDSH
ncbi:hypothetical protein [Massilia atriviolacea]|nr:hypothetical protein [Massilia atriviolacea]